MVDVNGREWEGFGFPEKMHLLPLAMVMHPPSFHYLLSVDGIDVRSFLLGGAGSNSIFMQAFPSPAVSLSCFQALVQHDSFDPNGMDASGSPSLTAAVRYFNQSDSYGDELRIEKVKVLVQAGADPDCGTPNPRHWVEMQKSRCPGLSLWKQVANALQSE